MCCVWSKLKRFKESPVFSFCLSSQSILFIHARSTPSQLITALLTVYFMSLWAWLTYSSTYAWVALKMPLSLTLWQHLYSLNVLLIVQETADTFGLVCLGVLFLSSQLLSRNFMFSVFLLSTDTSLSNTALKGTSQTPNTVKSLTPSASMWPHLRSVLAPKLTNLRSRLRK